MLRISMLAALVVIACLSSGQLGGAHAGDEVPMVSLGEFLKGVRIDSAHTIQFVSMRCAALYLTLASAIPSSDASRKEMQQGLSEKAGWFLVRAQGIQQKVAPDNASFEGGFVMGNVRKMQELYVHRAVGARARTGHFSDDPIIRTDSEYCRALVSP